MSYDRALFRPLDKQFEQLITNTPHSLTMPKTANAEFSFIGVWFTDQNNIPLEIEIM